ncbi:MAG: hypothetical protein RR233_08375 [Clostridiales bacterium]
MHHRAEVLESMIKQRTNNQFPYGFPVEIVDGAIRLILYDVKMQDKVGIKSESLSRHSVTYDTGEFVAGYPVNMLDFMKPYMKARF